MPKRKSRKQNRRKLSERERAQEAWKQRGKQERRDGLRSTDPSDRYLDDPNHFLGPDRDWRQQPATAAQARELRRRGLNALAYRTRGAAADALDRKRSRP